MEKDVVTISTLHISSGSFTLQKYADQSGEVENFNKSFLINLQNNKLNISEKLPAKHFKGGAEERDYLYKWLKEELQE